MSFVYAIGSVLAALLLIFLLYKLCKPEDVP
jgi:hypothetical protein